MAQNLEETCRNNPHIRGEVLDQKYRILGYIGGGGMACVYKVRTVDDPHPYALKLLQDQYFNNPYVLDLFRKEGERLLHLQHPNIVRFYNLEVQADKAYILMEYVDGHSLHDLIRRLAHNRRKLPINEVMRIVVQASRALQYLHTGGLIHRDIKAANFLIQSRTGKVYLTDFGIATEAGDQITLDAGTRGYMAPEQQQKSEIEITDSVDLYAFAIVAFELLTGTRPFRPDPGLSGRAAEQNLVQKHLEAPVPAVTAYRPDLPPELDAIFEKALAKKPHQRYDSARSFVEALHAALLPMLAEDTREIDEIAPLDPYDLLKTSLTPDPTLTTTGETLPASAGGGRRWLTLAMVVLVVVLVGAAILMMMSGNQDDGGSPETDDTGVVAGVASPTDLPPTKPDQAMTADVDSLITEEPAPPIIETEAITEVTAEPTTRAINTSEPEVTSEVTPEASIEAATTTEPAAPPATEAPDQPIEPTDIQVNEGGDGEVTEATAIPAPTDTPIPTSTPTVTPSPTETSAPTATPSPPPTETPTPQPTPYLSGVGYLPMWEGAQAFGLEADFATSLDLLMREMGGNLLPFNVGQINGFRVELAMADQANVQAYGIAYRVQNQASYLRFVIDPAAQQWRIEAVEDETVTLLDEGTIEDPALSLTAMGVDEFFRFEIGSQVIQHTTTLFSQGGLGLYLVMAQPGIQPPIESLRIGLAGADAEQAVQASPTPAQVINMQRFLLEDVRLLRDASDALNLAVDCLLFVPVYDNLERHLTRDEAVARPAQSLISTGALIRTGCDLATSDTADFFDTPEDFLSWDSELNRQLQALEAAP